MHLVAFVQFKKLNKLTFFKLYKCYQIAQRTTYTFKFSNRFFKQVDSCATEGPLSVDFSDIYRVKIGNDVVILSKRMFY